MEEGGRYFMVPLEVLAIWDVKTISTWQVWAFGEDFCLFPMAKYDDDDDLMLEYFYKHAFFRGGLEVGQCAKVEVAVFLFS